MKNYFPSTTSIPANLPVTESARFLSFIKVKYQPGYFPKSDLEKLSRQFGKDMRTIQKYLFELKDDGLLGEDDKMIYLRSWKQITGLKKWNSQAFACRLNEITQKKIFECKLFSAKVTGLGKAIVRKKGMHKSIGFPTGLLSKVFKLSTGKVSRLKKQAQDHRFLKVEKKYTDFGAGTWQEAGMLNKENPGHFVYKGEIKKRETDIITSGVLTYRIKNRRYDRK